jgi:Protein of unknown function (DUF3168)
MNVTTLVAPSAEPLGLAEAKDYLRIAFDGEDDLVAGLISGARSRIEETARVALITRTLRVTLDRWPARTVETRVLRLLRELLGDPVRVEEAGSPRPAFPYLEVVRHEVRPAGSLGVEASEHLVDMAVVSRDLGGRQARAAVAAMREALDDSELMIEGGQCVLVLAQFTDTMRTRPGLWRSLLRIRAIVEPAD